MDVPVRLCGVLEPKDARSNLLQSGRGAIDPAPDLQKDGIGVGRTNQNSGHRGHQGFSSERTAAGRSRRDVLHDVNPGVSERFGRALGPSLDVLCSAYGSEVMGSGFAGISSDVKSAISWRPGADNRVHDSGVHLVGWNSCSQRWAMII